MRSLLMTALGSASILLSSCSGTEGNAVEPFTGRWRTDVASIQIDEKPKEYLLKNGTYSCLSCDPQLSIKADGEFHEVVGRTSFDNMSAQIIDQRVVNFVHRLGEAVVGRTSFKVSPDDKLLMMEVTEPGEVGGSSSTSRSVDARVGSSLPGAHAISGSWKTAVNPDTPAEALIFNIAADGQQITLEAAGQSYSARVNGPEVPVKGEPQGTMISLEQPAPNSLKETYTRGGKVVRITTMTLEDDGTMVGTSEDRSRASITRYRAKKI